MNKISFDDSRLKILKEYKKYFWIFFISCVVGCVFVKGLNADFILRSYDRINIHFELPFFFDDSASAFLLSALSTCASDFVCIALVFILSFTRVKCIAAFSALVYNGLKFGASGALLLSCKFYCGHYPLFLSVVAFFVFSFFINFVLAVFFYHTQNRGESLKLHFSYFAFALFAISMIRVTYCLVIYLI